MPDKIYEFKDLEKIDREEMLALNRVHASFPETEELSKILKSVSDVLLSYDICNVENLEIGLLVKSGGEGSKPQFHRIQKSLISLGRTNENSIPLKSPLVSKKHAEIIRRSTDYFLRDLNSNNGTYLNDVRLAAGTDVILRNDDVIKIEPYELVVGLSYDMAKESLTISQETLRMSKVADHKGQVVVFFQIEPSQKKCAVALDEQTARWMVQKILAGQQESAAPWSEIESGLLEYLAARIASSVNPFLNNLRLILQTVEKGSDALQRWISSEKFLAEICLKTKTELGPSFCYIYLPLELFPIQKAASNHQAFLSSAEWIRHLNYTFAIQLGASMLSSGQISLLEEGDIILPDRIEIVLDPKGPKGKVELRCGQLQRGAVRASLECDGKGNCHLTIDAVYQEGLKHMSEANKKTEGQPASSEHGVVSAVEIPVTVEFARVGFTLEELSAMKEGQVIELEKASPELVDLSVEGKVIANGKLVDVEGKLGIRIMKVVKR